MSSNVGSVPDPKTKLIVMAECCYAYLLRYLICNAVLPLYVQEELFQLPGLHTEVALIRDCLDTGTPDKMRILLLHPLMSCSQSIEMLDIVYIWP